MCARPLALIAMLAALTASVQAATSIAIDQRGQVFDKKAIAIALKDRLIFTNHDDVTHNISVYVDGGDAVDLGLQKPGVALQYVFDKDGLFTIRCSIHPTMRMKVAVK